MNLLLLSISGRVVSNALKGRPIKRVSIWGLPSKVKKKCFQDISKNIKLSLENYPHLVPLFYQFSSAQTMDLIKEWKYIFLN